MQVTQAMHDTSVWCRCWNTWSVLWGIQRTRDFANWNVKAMEELEVDLHLADSVLAREMKQQRSDTCHFGLTRMRQWLQSRRSVEQKPVLKSSLASLAVFNTPSARPTSAGCGQTLPDWRYAEPQAFRLTAGRRIIYTMVVYFGVRRLLIEVA